MNSIWRVERAACLSIIVDADDYFRFAREAMINAKKRIMLVGWDFDARVQLVREGHMVGEPVQVGDFILWLVERNPDLEIYLLRWSMGAIQSLFRGNTAIKVLKWMRHPRIFTKLDSAHPLGASHHQKIIVIDDHFAFCGGIDVTAERWDTREHRDDDDRRLDPNGKKYGPWHDASSALQGPAAMALAELARERWVRAGGRAITPVTDAASAWPQTLPVDFTDVEVGIARTMASWNGDSELREIENLFVDQIAGAQHFIYAESQYFASRRIAEAIAKRLDEENGPEIVLMNPLSAQGWLEPMAMDTARARLVAALQHRDKWRRFRIYHPLTSRGEGIYIHAKVMMIDDHTLRIGSANMNNRSLGLDTECDIVLSASRPGDKRCVALIRDGLLAEHLGVSRERVTKDIEDNNSLIGCIERLNGKGRLRPYEVPNLSAIEAWLADNEVLDPESAQEMFEVATRRGLLDRLRHGRFSRHRGAGSATQ